MNKKVLILGVLTVLLSITIAIGFSYAVWTQTKEQEVANTFSVGCFNIEISKQENAINLNNDYPITDETGKIRVPFTFTVTNTCDYYGNYAVNLEKLTGSDLGNQYIKVMLNNKRPQLYDYYNIASKEDINSVDSRTLTTDGLNAGESKEYSLRIWLDESGTNETVGGKTFNSKIVISAVATYQSGAEYIASLLTSNPETMKNDDPDENVRYIGAIPNNYVTFNDEQWRIIGVFDMFECADDATVENYTSKCSTKKLLKIIRNESIGGYSWDSSDVNDWSKSTLQQMLNTESYWQKTNLSDSNGLELSAKEMITTTMWNIGGRIDTYISTTLMFYNSERGDITYSGHPTKWIGKVGLMYPSDYGYATSGGTIERNACLLEYIYEWRNEEFYDCVKNDWLFSDEKIRWTISPYSGNSWDVVRISNGGTYFNHSNLQYNVYPVVYLKSDVKIIHDANHDGSVDKPYELTF